jgi:hypothetical protein
MMKIKRRKTKVKEEVMLERKIGLRHCGGLLVAMLTIITGCSKNPASHLPDDPDPSSAWIRVTNPYGGENFAQGNSIQVSWESQGISGPVEIRLDYPGFSGVIRTSTPNDGSESITIPADYPTKSDWHVVVTDYDDNTWGVSDDFSIGSSNQKWIRVTNPQGGETLAPGGTINVTWESQGISGSVEIRLDYPGYSGLVLPSTPNDGSQTITIPSNYPARCDWHVVVTDYDENTWGASADFCIGSSVQKWIRVTNPQGGESFAPGSIIQVNWTSQGISGPVEIRLDYPGYSLRILTSTPNDGTQSITIPSGFPARCDWHVIVTDYDESTWGASAGFCITAR